MTGGQGLLSPGQRMLCGLGAGMSVKVFFLYYKLYIYFLSGMTEAVLVVTWIETLKVRLIADQKKPQPRFRGLYHAAATIVREEVRGEVVKEQSSTIQCSGLCWCLQGCGTHCLQTGVKPSYPVLHDGVSERTLHRWRSQCPCSLLSCGSLWSHSRYLEVVYAILKLTNVTFRWR